MASTKPVIEKLGVKSDERTAFINSPLIFKLLPDRVITFDTLDGLFDFVLIFADDLEFIEGYVDNLKSAITPKGKIWIAWKKGNVTDLNRDNLANLVMEHALVPVNSISIDDTWSALKFMHPKDQRK